MGLERGEWRRGGEDLLSYIKRKSEVQSHVSSDFRTTIIFLFPPAPLLLLDLFFIHVLANFL